MQRKYQQVLVSFVHSSAMRVDVGGVSVPKQPSNRLDLSSLHVAVRILCTN